MSSLINCPNIRLLVLAGGFGSRLQSAVGDIPKALAPIGTVPFLRVQLENWVAQGLSRFSFLLHHKADELIEFIKGEMSGLLKDCHVDWVVEPVPMDTGGAVAHAISELQIKDDFLVANADTWLGTGMFRLIDSPSPSMAVIQLSDVGRYGKVLIGKDSFITQFTEKSEISMPGWINAGIFHLEPSYFKDWNGRPFSLERDLFPDLVLKGILKAVPLETEFLDIGVPEDYSRFCSWVEKGRSVPL